MKKLIAWPVCFVLAGCLAALAQDGNDAKDKKTAGASPAPADAPVVKLVVELADGSRIIGTPVGDRLKIATGYADMEIPWSRLRRIEFASSTDRAVRVGMQNGDSLNGRLAATDITMKTVFGQAVIPVAQVSTIRVGRTGHALPEGLVLYYSFDEDEGARVTDESSAGNDGTVRGAVYTNEGKVGGAMSFGGGGEVVSVGNPASLRLQNFTIMAWIKRGSADKVSQNAIWGDLFGYTHGGYVFGIREGGHLYMGKADPPSTSFSSFAVSDQAFHHVAVTKQGNKIVFYLDGMAYPSSDYNTEFEFNTTAAVGGRDEYSQNTFFGVIDEVAIFNRALSADEVKGVHESQK